MRAPQFTAHSRAGRKTVPQPPLTCTPAQRAFQLVFLQSIHQKSHLSWTLHQLFAAASATTQTLIALGLSEAVERLSPTLSACPSLAGTWSTFSRLVKTHAWLTCPYCWHSIQSSPERLQKRSPAWQARKKEPHLGFKAPACSSFASRGRACPSRYL